MANRQEIEIVIGKDGKVTFQIKGVKGPQCLAETKFLEDALGGGVLEREKTGEFYEEGQGVGAGQWAGSSVGGEEDSD